MASVQERLKLKRAPSDTWSIREQLCLASSVLKSGDQNWISVSRSLKPVADRNSIRPADWYSQKSCAQQYTHLIENSDIPKRKKRESGETTSEFIVRRLTHNRISELKINLAAQKEEYLKLKNELSLLKNGTISDDKLKKMWSIIEDEEKEKEKVLNSNVRAASSTMRQPESESQSSQISNVSNMKKKADNISTDNHEIVDKNISSGEKINPVSCNSSLLTNLLKSESSHIQSEIPSKKIDSSKIVNILSSNPKGSEQKISQNISPQQTNKNIDSNVVHDRPSLCAPTLSKLLEHSFDNNQTILQQKLENISDLVDPKKSDNSMKIKTMTQAKSVRSTQDNKTSILPTQETVKNPVLLDSEEPPEVTNSTINKIIPKIMEINKDEINEIIGDLEEIIKEEIIGPEKIDSALKKVETVSEINKLNSINLLDCNEKNIDNIGSLSNSPTSEISVEIDSSTSNIAKIIGTAIETSEPTIKSIEFSKESENYKESKTSTDCAQKKLMESKDSEKSKSENNTINKTMEESKNKTHNKVLSEVKNQEENKQVNKSNERNLNDIVVDHKNMINQESSTKSSKCENQEKLEVVNSEKSNVNLKEKSKLDSQDKEEEKLPSLCKIENEKSGCDSNEEIIKKEDNTQVTKIQDKKSLKKVETKSSKNISENDDENSQDIKPIKIEPLEEKSSMEDSENENNLEKMLTDLKSQNEDNKVDFDKSIISELSTSKDFDNCSKNKISIDDSISVSNFELNNKLESIKNEIEEIDNLQNKRKLINQMEIEDKKESNDIKKELKSEIEQIKVVDDIVIKKENIESSSNVDDLDEEEPMLNKMSSSRVMKTYSKKQNPTVDSEPENETAGETADYRAWKKSIMLVYNRLATHKYASIFLRPITEDQAPGYHSIVFRPMDLGSIKKNIDNGTIRTTAHFQRDVMLMFQNAIMYNKHHTHVHKMTLGMQEDCLQHLQVLVRAAGEASFRRETRTAANVSSEVTDNSMKRKWVHVSSNPHDFESPRLKKRRKSEND